MPKAWTGGSLNRWIAASPRRMLAFWLFMLSFACAIIAWAITQPDSYFGSAYAISGLVGAALFLIQTIRYLPRIVRAIRRR